MSDNLGFCRFQYSVFDKSNGLDGQWVVRGNDWEKFIADRELVIATLPRNTSSTTVQPAVTVETTSTGYPCKTCGSPTIFKQGRSAKGDWRGYFCTKDKDHAPAWLK